MTDEHAVSDEFARWVRKKEFDECERRERHAKDMLPRRSRKPRPDPVASSWTS
jgi:hypothetical protein